MTEVPLCNFNTEYYDYDARDDKLFQCRENPIAGSMTCAFHAEKYPCSPENKERLTQRLKEMIAHSISNNESLFCIGFYIPWIEFHQEFQNNVYFNHAQFERASFSKAQFHHPADFSGAIFYGRTNFSDTIFHDSASSTWLP